MCVAANLSDQFPNTRRESAVMVRSWQSLTCLGRPWHPSHCFPKRIGWQMFSAKSPTQDGKVRALTVACENSISQAEGRIRLSFFQKWVWRQKILAQAWDSTWKSEVPARGEQNRRCADKLRRRRCFFFKMCVAANLSDQFLNMRRESEVMARS